MAAGSAISEARRAKNRRHRAAWRANNPGRFAELRPRKRIRPSRTELLRHGDTLLPSYSESRPQGPLYALRQQAPRPSRKEALQNAEARRKRSAIGRQAFLEWLKLGAGCSDCGYRTRACALDFDHVPERGPKRWDLARMARQAWSWDTIQEELQKCDVVCANCHRVRTTSRWESKRPPLSELRRRRAAYAKEWRTANREKAGLR